MSIVVSIHKRKGILVASFLAIAALGYLVSPFIQHFYHGIARRVAGTHFGMGGVPIHKDSVILPDVVVETGRTVCCRMKFCDFRFPLPRGMRISQVDPVTGGWDTIKGALYVTNADGGMVDLEAYAKLMYEDGFNTSVGDFFISASSADGGFITAYTTGPATKITFSFFGDY